MKDSKGHSQAQPIAGKSVEASQGINQASAAGIHVRVIIAPSDPSSLESLSPEATAHFMAFIKERERQGMIGRIRIEDSPNGTYVLFETPEAAHEVAYTLQGAWDGCTGVEITDFDSQAFQTAVKLANAQWCEVGDSELIAKEKRSHDPQVHLHELPLPDPRGLTFPISRAEVYWCISDWNGSHHAEDVARVTDFSKSTVQGHLSALEQAGAIRSMGRPKQYTVAEDCPPAYLTQLQSCASLARLMRGTRGG